MAKEYNPQMHSAEHILNRTMVRKFNCGRSFSAHIEKKKSKCDYHFDRDLTKKEVSEIEGKVNEIINSNLKISEELININDAASRYDLSKLPESSGNEIRIIKIGNYDACPCIGQHVKSTREIGTFKITSTNYSDKVLRIRFKLL